MDARVEPGHDESKITPVGIIYLRALLRAAKAAD
jgi:hypothetical protein